MEFRPIRLYREEEFSKTKIENGSLVLATATSFIGSTLYCNVNGRNAIINVTDIDDSYSTDAKQLDKQIKTAKSLVGKRILARVLKINSNGLIVLERKSVLNETRNILKENIGETVDCTIESFAPFGLFVDIGNGVISLIPIVEVSRSHYYNLENYFDYGEVLKVKILNYDIEKEVFQLSRKKAYDVMTEEDLPRGSVIMVSVHNFIDEIKSGVFFEYDPGNIGIMDIPEWINPDIFYDGRIVAAQVKLVDPNKGIKASFSHFI